MQDYDFSHLGPAPGPGPVQGAVENGGCSKAGLFVLFLLAVFLFVKSQGG